MVRLTIWLALLFYALAIVPRLWIGPRWRQAPSLQSWSRALWTLALLAYLAHVAAAFHEVHGWSRVRAFEHVAEQSGFGPGIFVSYAFSVIWLADAVWWWLAPASYLSRARWLDATLHGFLLFIIVNGAVVFASGPSRLIGLALLAALLIAWGHGLSVSGAEALVAPTEDAQN